MKRKLLDLMLLLCLTMVGQKAMAQTWTPQTLEDGVTYYVLNKASNLFVSADATLAEGSPVAFTATVTENACKLVNGYGCYAAIEIEANDGTFGKATPKSTSASFDGEETELTFSGSAEEGYIFSKTVSWKYGAFNRNSTSYTGYITVSEGAIACTDNAADENAVWTLVSVDEYKASPAGRNDALARLDKAIADADEAMGMEGMTAAGKAAIGIAQTASKTLKNTATSSISFIANRVKTDDIIKSAENLESKIAEYRAIADYYQACMAEIEAAEAMGGAVPAACTVAKGALQLATDTKAMDAAMSTLRTACTARLATGNTIGDGFEDNVDFTGLIGNNSFDRGNMSGWYTLKVDLGNAIGSIGDIANLIKGDGGNLDFSKIADIISVDDFSENSHPIVNEGRDAMKNGHNRYYYYTHDKGQMIFQPVIGLPAGTYRASALMNSKGSGLLSLSNNCHISAIIIPTSILGDVIKGVDLGAIVSGKTDDILKGLLGNIGEILGKAEIKSVNGKASKSDEFAEVSLDFEVGETSIVLLALNASNPLIALPLIGEEWFKADNVRLTHVKSQKRAGKELADAIADANIPEANIAAKPSAEHPFTYKESTVNEYKKVLEAAQAVKDSDEKSAAKIDAAADKLREMNETFFDKAFQGPSAKDIFNMVMNDAANKTGLGKSVTVKNGVIAFSDEAGTTNFNQTLSFEKAGEAVNSYIISYTDPEGIHYLSSNTQTDFKSADKETATVFNVVPSMTEETAVSTQLHKSVKVVPASMHEVALNISAAGWGTFVLPFEAAIPAGVNAYRVTAVDADNVLVLDKAAKFEACTPYLVECADAEGNPQAFKTTLEGYSMATANLCQDGLLTGAFQTTPVAANAGNYLLQNQKVAGTDEYHLAFYLVADEGLKIGANRCYLTAAGESAAKMIGLSEQATAIKAVESAKDAVIYDLSGRRVGKAGRGVYIINGQKIVK